MYLLGSSYITWGISRVWTVIYRVVCGNACSSALNVYKFHPNIIVIFVFIGTARCNSEKLVHQLASLESAWHNRIGALFGYSRCFPWTNLKDILDLYNLYENMNCFKQTIQDEFISAIINKLRWKVHFFERKNLRPNVTTQNSTKNWKNSNHSTIHHQIGL